MYSPTRVNISEIVQVRSGSGYKFFGRQTQMIYLKLDHVRQQYQLFEGGEASAPIGFIERIKLLNGVAPGDVVKLFGTSYRVLDCAENVPPNFLKLEPYSDALLGAGIADLRVFHLANRVFDHCETVQKICFHALKFSQDLFSLTQACILLLAADQKHIATLWHIDQNGVIDEPQDKPLTMDSQDELMIALTHRGVLMDAPTIFRTLGLSSTLQSASVVQSIFCDDQPLGWFCADNHPGFFQANDDRCAILSAFITMTGQWIIRKQNDEKLHFLCAQLEHEVAKKTADLNVTIERLNQTQQALVTTERTKALSVFTAGVAHEINNPIGFIRSNLSYIGKISSRVLESIQALKFPELQQSISWLQDVDLVIDESVEGLDRVSHIISMLQPLNNLADEVPQSFRLLKSVDTALMRFKGRILKNITVNNQLADIRVTLPLQIVTLALESIIQNAIDATSDMHCPVIEISLFQENKMVCICCEDNGCGISAANINSIFLPFFTTKAPVERLGLGLSLSQTLIQFAGGWIEVQSREKIGTKLTICFDEEVIVNE